MGAWSVVPPQLGEAAVDRSGRPIPPPWVTAPLAAQGWMTGVCWAATTVAAVVVAVWVWCASWPGGLGLVQFGIEVVAIAVGLWWVVLVALHIAARWENRRVQRSAGSSWPVRGTVALAVAGCLWVVGVGSLVTDAPLRMRFELSRPAFDDAAATGEAARAAATPAERAEADRAGRVLASFDTEGRLGLYPAGYVGVELYGVSVHPYGPWLSRGWFAYLPDGVPAWWGDPGFPHRLSLGDGWWALWFNPYSFD